MSGPSVNQLGWGLFNRSPNCSPVTGSLSLSVRYSSSDVSMLELASQLQFQLSTQVPAKQYCKFKRSKQSNLLNFLYQQIKTYFTKTSMVKLKLRFDHGRSRGYIKTMAYSQGVQEVQ